MFRMIRSAALFLLLVPFPAGAAVTCADVSEVLGPRLADVNCFASTDLTTANPRPPRRTTRSPGCHRCVHADHRSQRDLADAGNRTPITSAVPGLQLRARFADDPTGQARLLLRLPTDWNGRLVVAGASGTRSEDNGDFAWSDYVLQKGYAYASQNKGVLNLAAWRPPPPDPRRAGSTRRRRFGCGSSTTIPPSRSPGGPSTWSRTPGSRGAPWRPTTIARRASPTPSAPPTAATRSGARSRRRPSCSTAGSTGRARSSTRAGRTS